MSQTYTVASGDTLLGIAIKKKVDFNTLLALNPKYQKDPDVIYINDTIVLPEPPIESKPTLAAEVKPVAPMKPQADATFLEMPPQCKGQDIEDIAFLTDDDGQFYYGLTSPTYQELEQEISYTQQILAGYKHILYSTPDSNAPEKDKQAH